MKCCHHLNPLVVQQIETQIEKVTVAPNSLDSTNKIFM